MFNQTPQKIVTTNRWPLLAGIVILLLVLGLFMFKTQMRQNHRMPEGRPNQSVDVSPKQAENSWFNEEKFRNIKMGASVFHKPSSEEVEAQAVSRQDMGLKKAEIEDEYAAHLEIQKMQDKNLIDEKKMELEASRSPLSVEVPPVPGTKMTTQTKGHGKNDLTGQLNDLMDAVQSMAAGKISSLMTAPSQGAVLDNIIPEGKQAFLNPASGGDDYLEHHKTKPRSAFEIKAGSYIPAALITGVNSDLPGTVNAQVTENVYDSITGNYLLIPQGAKLIGEYNSRLTFGQDRVQVVWNRIIFPDGQSIDLDKMQGSDISGYTGFYDKVDNHYFRVYGSAILLSLVGAGYDILNQNEENSTDARSAVSANVGQKLSDVTDQALQKNLDVQPTLVIRPGYKFMVMVMKDMTLDQINDAPGTLSYSK